MNRRGFLAAAGALALPGCGGGGGSSPSASGTITPAPAVRKDIGYGYFFGQADYVNEVADHCNLWWAAYNSQPVQQIAGLTHAKAAGYREIVLDLPAYPLPVVGQSRPDPEREIRFFLERLDALNLLAGVTCIYPRDEPNNPRVPGGSFSDAEVNERNDLIRKIVPDYGLSADIDLGVFYSVGDRDRPGFATYTRLGLSAYETGNGQGGMLDAWEPRLTARQRTWVIPYGAQPWGIDPAGLMAYAHRTPRVAAVIPFGWQTLGNGAYLGIREQPVLRELYRQAGQAIKSAR